MIWWPLHAEIQHQTRWISWPSRRYVLIYVMEKELKHIKDFLLQPSQILQWDMLESTADVPQGIIKGFVLYDEKDLVSYLTVLLPVLESNGYQKPE